MLHRPMFRLMAVLFLAAGTLGYVSERAPTAADMEWHRVPTPLGTLNVALVRPLGEGNGDRHPVILALPWGSGSAQLVESFVGSYWLTDPMLRGYYVVAPEVRGSTLVDTADELIPAIFEWMESELFYDESRVALVGASNGGRGLFYAALSEPDRFRALVGLPGQHTGSADQLSVLQGKPIWLLVGELDAPWVAGTESTASALESVGISSRVDIVPGQGHVIRLDPNNLLDWIDKALDR